MILSPAGSRQYLCCCLSDDVVVKVDTLQEAADDLLRWATSQQVNSGDYCLESVIAEPQPPVVRGMPKIMTRMEGDAASGQARCQPKIKI